MAGRLRVEVAGRLVGEEQARRIGDGASDGDPLLLADEPTGNLDPQTAGRVFSTLVALVRASGLAALIATHNMELAARMDRRLTIRDGLLVDMGEGPLRYSA